MSPNQFATVLAPGKMPPKLVCKCSRAWGRPGIAECLWSPERPVEDSQCAENSEPKGESKRREDLANNYAMPKMLSDAYTLFVCIV